METNINYTVVGAFVIILTAFIVVGIIWLSSGASSNVEYSFYKVYMKESVSGLNVNAAVEYNGVSVGAVTNIEINPRNPQLVELLLRVKSSTPITQGTKAKLDMKTLSGLAFILLEDKGTDMRPLRARRGEKYPVISTTPSLLVRVDTALTQLNASFQQISASITSLLNPENIRSIKQILQASENTLRLIETQTLPSTNNAMRLFESQTIPAANDAMMNLNNVARNLSDVSNEIKQNPAVLIRGREQPALGPGEK
jgi:phospholipid/cholesterol/gamma-HCH transport system substrate-binding protein